VGTSSRWARGAFLVGITRQGRVSPRWNNYGKLEKPADREAHLLRASLTATFYVHCCFTITLLPGVNLPIADQTDNLLARINGPSTKR
jgi:hypothetical protein